MELDELKRRFSGLPPEIQLRVLATLGHNLKIAAGDIYEFQAPGVLAPQRLRDINEIQRRVFGHIVALATEKETRYPDDDVISIILDFGDEDMRAQSLWALQDALERSPA
jgi:hypothetical protein